MENIFSYIRLNIEEKCLPKDVMSKKVNSIARKLGHSKIANI